MASQKQLDKTYMSCAFEISKLSKAKRRQVGCIVIAKEGGIIAEGYNGSPSGFDNNCEILISEGLDHNWVKTDQTFADLECSRCKYLVSQMDLPPKNPCVPAKYITKPEVLHAESNAILKIACSTNSSKGATLYVTCSPCFDCAKLIIQAKISRVVYLDDYKSDDGIIKNEGVELLRKAGVIVEKS